MNNQKNKLVSAGEEDVVIGEVHNGCIVWDQDALFRVFGTSGATNIQNGTKVFIKKLQDTTLPYNATLTSPPFDGL